MPRANPSCPGGITRAGVPALLAALLVASCGAGTPTPSPSSAPGTVAPATAPLATPAGPTPVIIDTDLSADDTLAIPFLLREPSIDVVAVTVVGTGLVHCRSGMQGVMNLLATLGLEGIPVSCGREEPLAGSHAFPAEWRAGADDAFGLNLERRSVTLMDEDAPELIRSVARSSDRPVTIVALGPLTNVAEALQGDQDLPARIERIVAMGGAVDVPGNVSFEADESNPLPAEWNVYADPTAADIVFRSGVPITLVPLDATNAVPIDAAFVAALGADHAAAPADIAYELLSRRGLLPGEYLWDPLAAVVAVDESVVTLETIPLRVETAEGPDSGRTARTDGGSPVRVATSADRQAFEARFLAGLRVGGPRANPFTLTGSFPATFDGTTCADEAPDTLAAGNWMINGDVTADGTTVLVVVRFHDGSTWDDLLAYFATATDPTDQPSFVDVATLSFVEDSGTLGMVAPMTPGDYGIACLHFTGSESLGYPGSGPFTV
ncbi:MAG: nucleoside hydrolase, partial [Chloroflexi bacterium]|nr:nucleoside hydrolase [Chloroflexota bacterium]